MGQSSKSRSEAAKKAAATRKKNQQKQEENAPQVDRGADSREQAVEGQELDVDRSDWAERREPTPEQRAQELEAAQQVHAQRTGGGEVREGELEAQRQTHNERTGG